MHPLKKAWNGGKSGSGLYRSIRFMLWVFSPPRPPCLPVWIPRLHRNIIKISRVGSAPETCAAIFKSRFSEGRRLSSDSPFSSLSVFTYLFAVRCFVHWADRRSSHCLSVQVEITLRLQFSSRSWLIIQLFILKRFIQSRLCTAQKRQWNACRDVRQESRDLSPGSAERARAALRPSSMRSLCEGRVYAVCVNEECLAQKPRFTLRYSAADEFMRRQKRSTMTHRRLFHCSPFPLRSHCSSEKSKVKTQSWKLFNNMTNYTIIPQRG